MRILNWMQNKLAGRPAEKKSSLGSSHRHSMHEAPKEEFSDWPQALLAIGTFGNNQLNRDFAANDSSVNSNSSRTLSDFTSTVGTSENSNSSRTLSDFTATNDIENWSCSHNLSDFTEEEIGKLQKELTKLLALKSNQSRNRSGREAGNHPLDKFLNCPSSLEVDRTNCSKFCDDSNDDKDGDLSRNSSVVLSKGKEVYTDNKKAIKQKSVSFLLKKMFACRRGCSPTRSLRDPMPESRMEKLLRMILHKKIIHQNCGSKSSKKYLVNRHTLKIEEEDQTQEKSSDGYKWVKTDSDFIVLEI